MIFFFEPLNQFDIIFSWADSYIDVFSVGFFDPFWIGLVEDLYSDDVFDDNGSSLFLLEPNINNQIYIPSEFEILYYYLKQTEIQVGSKEFKEFGNKFSFFLKDIRSYTPEQAFNDVSGFSITKQVSACMSCYDVYPPVDFSSDEKIAYFNIYVIYKVKEIFSYLDNILHRTNSFFLRSFSGFLFFDTIFNISADSNNIDFRNNVKIFLRINLDSVTDILEALSYFLTYWDKLDFNNGPINKYLISYFKYSIDLCLTHLISFYFTIYAFQILNAFDISLLSFNFFFDLITTCSHYILFIDTFDFFYLSLNLFINFDGLLLLKLLKILISYNLLFLVEKPEIFGTVFALNKFLSIYRVLEDQILNYNFFKLLTNINENFPNLVLNDLLNRRIFESIIDSWFSDSDLNSTFFQADVLYRKFIVLNIYYSLLNKLQSDIIWFLDWEIIDMLQLLRVYFFWLNLLSLITQFFDFFLMFLSLDSLFNFLKSFVLFLFSMNLYHLFNIIVDYFFLMNFWLACFIEILFWYGFSIFSYYLLDLYEFFYLSNWVVTIFKTIFIIVFFFYLAFNFENNNYIWPRFWQIAIESFYGFLVSIFKDQVGYRGQKYFPFLATIFIFVFFLNIVGMIPYEGAATSQLIFNLSLSFSILIILTIIGFLRQGKNYLNIFLPPKGVPQVLIPLLIFIEIVSYLARGISLGVRLFANIMAGHTLLYIFSTFALNVNFFLALGIFLVIYLVTFLEFFISSLQAYVFYVLSAMYFRDSIEVSH